MGNKIKIKIKKEMISSINHKNENVLFDTNDITIITQNKSDNSVKRQTLPKWLVVWWWIAIICAMPLYLRILWEQTLLTWTHGQQNVGWTIIHNYIEFFIFGIIGFLLVFVWILSACIYFLVKKKCPAKNTIFYFAVPLVAIALSLVINSSL